MRIRVGLAIILGLSLIGLVARAGAQSGMSKATAKLLVTDLIEAGLTPQIRESGGAYIIVVSSGTNAPTSAQVTAFATARGVTAKVLTVQFE